jgi:hypothetical protein
MTTRRKKAEPLAEQTRPAIAFRDRIVEFRRVKASELLANPKNWRLHPQSQRGALSGLLKDIGFVGAILARQVNDGLEILDGHLRQEEAGDADVPVLITDLNDEEAAKLLATYDPLSSMEKAGEAYRWPSSLPMEKRAASGPLADLCQIPIRLQVAIMDAEHKLCERFGYD